MTSTLKSASAGADATRATAARTKPSRRWLRSNRLVVDAIVLGAIVLAILVLPYLLPYEAPAQNARDTFRSPLSPGTDGIQLLGTDAFTRDLFARLLLGAPISLLVSCGARLSAALVGVTLGLITGYARGWVGALIMRLVDVERPSRASRWRWA